MLVIERNGKFIELPDSFIEKYLESDYPIFCINKELYLNFRVSNNLKKLLAFLECDKAVLLSIKEGDTTITKNCNVKRINLNVTKYW